MVLILAVAFFALLAWNVRGCFADKKQESAIDKILELKDSSIAQSHRREIEHIKSAAEDRAKAQEFKDKDTVYIRQLVNNDKQLKDIINSVRDASKDELRSYRPED